MATSKTALFSEIDEFIKALNPDSISSERKAVLQPLIDFIQAKVSNHHQKQPCSQK